MPNTMNEHLVSLGFAVDQKSYNQMIRTTGQINSAISNMASHISAKITEAILSVAGLDKALERVKTTLHKATTSGESKGASSGGTAGKSGGSMATAQDGLKKFAASAVKYFGEASAAVATFSFAVAAGTASLLNGLGQQEIQMEMLSRTMWTTQRQALSFSLSLKVLGATLQDLYLSPTLLAQYEKLHAVAMQMQTPTDYNSVIKTVQNVSLGFEQMQLEAYYALQWIGYYFVKYMEGPISGVQGVLNNINAAIIHNMPTWTKQVADVMASFMQAGVYIVQALASVYNWLAKMLAYIPGWAKGIVDAFVALNIAMEVTPLGRYIMAISAAILIFDDFETYLHKGKSALGAFGGVLLIGIGLFAAWKTALIAQAVALGIWANMIAVSKWAMAAWSIVSKGATAAMIAMDAALDANPISLIIIAIAALVVEIVLLVTHLKEVEGWLVSLWGWWKKQPIAIQFLITALTSFATLPALIIANWTPLSAFFSNLWSGIVSVVQGAWTTIQQASIPAINGMSGVLNDLITVLDLIPGVHVGKIPTIRMPSAPVTPSNGHYVRPQGSHTSTKHVHVTQTNHIHGTGSPQATADAVSRGFSRHLHNIRGVIS